MRRFSETIETKASAQAVWAVWSNVNAWHVWDTELQSASIRGEFSTGTEGILVPKKGVKSKFVLTSVKPESQFAYTVSLPLGKLVVDHRLEATSNVVRFSHIVSFEGLSAPLFSRLLEPAFSKALPGVLQNIKELAEGSLTDALANG